MLDDFDELDEEKEEEKENRKSRVLKYKLEEVCAGMTDKIIH